MQSYTTTNLLPMTTTITSITKQTPMDDTIGRLTMQYNTMISGISMMPRINTPMQYDIPTPTYDYKTLVHRITIHTVNTCSNLRTQK